MRKKDLIMPLIFVYLILTIGCGGWKYRAYDGQELPKEEIAIIKSDDPVFVTIMAVDGKQPKSFGNQLLWGKPPAVVYVKPGVHIVSPGYCGYSSCESNCNIAINAEAGKTYVIKYKFNRFIKGPGFGEYHYDVNYWIEDINN